MTKFPKTFYGFYWLVIKKFPLYFGTIFACGVITNMLGIVFGPLTSKWMMQIFESAANTDFYNVLNIFTCFAGIYFLIFVLALVPSILRSRQQTIFNRYKLYLLYKRVYENDINYFVDITAGQITSYVIEVSGSLSKMVEKFWVELIGTSIGFCTIVITMFSMNYWFVVLLTGYGVIKIVWESLFQKTLKQNQKDLMDENAKYAGIRSDSINNALTVKYFANAEQENMYIYHGRKNIIKLVRWDGFIARCQWVPLDILWRCVLLAILVMCFFMIKDKSITISGGAYLVAAAGSVNSALNRITKLVRNYTIDSARVKKAYDGIIVNRKIIDKPHARN